MVQGRGGLSGAYLVVEDDRADHASAEVAVLIRGDEVLGRHCCRYSMAEVWTMVPWVKIVE